MNIFFFVLFLFSYILIISVFNETHYNQIL